MSAQNAPRIPLPKSWNKQVRSAMLHVISLAQYATVYTRSWAADSRNARVRLRRTIQQLISRWNRALNRNRMSNATKISSERGVVVRLADDFAYRF